MHMPMMVMGRFVPLEICDREDCDDRYGENEADTSYDSSDDLSSDELHVEDRSDASW
jgi:hypothetical protein